MTKTWKTSKGSHVHANFQCANQRRAITSGDPIECDPTELPPCEHCMPAGVVSAHLAVQAVKADAMCANAGVVAPKRIESECRSCGKRGKVNRSTGKLRAHRA